MGSVLGAVVLRVTDLQRQVAFWTAALDYVVRHEPEDDWVSLRPRDGRGVNLSFDRKRSAYALPPRLHLDLYAEDVDAEVARLVALGARVVPYDRYPPDADWVLLEDPEGNRFDVARLPDDAPSAVAAPAR